MLSRKYGIQFSRTPSPLFLSVCLSFYLSRSVPFSPDMLDIHTYIYKYAIDTEAIKSAVLFRARCRSVRGVTWLPPGERL